MESEINDNVLYHFKDQESAPEINDKFTNISCFKRQESAP